MALVQGDIEGNSKIKLATKCTKYTLNLLNVFYLINALLMLAAGVTSKITLDLLNLKLEFEREFELVSYLWIVSGIVLLFVSIFGIISASKNSAAWIFNYGIFLMVSFAIQTAVVVVAYALLSESDSFAKNILERLVNSAVSDEPTADAMDFVQKSLQCCGIYGANDWSNNLKYPFNNDFSNNHQYGRMPQSCCTSGSEYTNSRCNSYFEKGCLSNMSNSTFEIMMIIYCVALELATVQFVGIIIAFVVADMIRNMESYMSNAY